jgi:hypothetical protein
MDGLRVLSPTAILAYGFLWPTFQEAWGRPLGDWSGRWFKDRECLDSARGSGVFTPVFFTELHTVDERSVPSVVEFEQPNAVRATIVRLQASDDVGETDVYGARGVPAAWYPSQLVNRRARTTDVGIV